MKIELIPEGGHWYKANLHCHTALSDGKQSPEEVKNAYKEHGYHAVCFTDHEVLIPHEELCDKDFIALHGYEIAIKKDVTQHSGAFMPVYHFNLIAKSQQNTVMTRFFQANPSMPGNSTKTAEQYARFDSTIDMPHYEDVAWLNQYLKDLSDAGFLVVYNHPQWSLQHYANIIPLEHLHGIEVINGACFHYHDNTAIHFEQMLRAGKSLIPVAGDDNHNVGDFFNAWTMLKADALTYDALITALARGHCYASEGPEIQSLVLEDGKIIVKTSPAVSITLLSEGRHMQARRSRAETYTEAVFDFLPETFGSYFRLEVRDPQGYYAYSNAYYVKNLI